MTEVTLLDGAIGQELAHRARAEDNPLWSTAVMATSPDLVGQLHRDYFAAGATVATTNTYTLLTDRLAGSGLEDRIDDLVAIARAEAFRARDDHGSGRVAVSLGPLRQSYRGDLAWTVEETMASYRPVLTGIADADLVIAETVASLGQAETVRAAIRELTDLPIWMAVTVDDENGRALRSGEALSDLGSRLGDAEAVLLNCSRPDAISLGLPLIAENDLQYGAFANGFTTISKAFLGARPTVDALEARTDLGPDAYAKIALNWVTSGATIVGGCCEIGPDHIRTLHRALTTHGYKVI